MENRKAVLSYLDTLGLLLVGVGYFLFPLVFTSLTSDAFVLPKQIVLGVVVLVGLLLFGIRTAIDGKLRLRSTPFDLPVFLFAVVLFVSCLLSVNRADSLISYIPLLLAILLYFVTVNLIRDRKGLMFLLAALLLGSSLAALITVLSFFKIYLLPFQYTHVQFFTPVGTLLDQALLFGVVLPLAGYLAHPVYSTVLLHGKTETKTKAESHNVVFGVGFVVLALGLIVTIYQLITTQAPLIFPFWQGLSVGLQAISRDSSRSLQAFLFGSGYGTFLTDFTRFKDAIYNNNAKLWSFSFFRSSTFFFELLATTGFLGAASYAFIVYRVVKEKWFFLPIVLVLIASFFLPFSYVIQALLFMVLAIFSLVRAQQAPRRYPNTELYMVAFSQGLLSTKPEESSASTTKQSGILPIGFLIIVLAIVGAIGFYSVRFVLSDVTFQSSLVAAAQNNGGATYQLQRNAIQLFPYRDAYYRVFAQTNLALANNLAAAQPKGSSPSAETQQTILTLIQQSINSGRSAVTISPLTALNWNNLSSIYRSLIGFGQNADQFSVLTNQQAIALDPNNPQQYINLGGIYYQLGQYDEAERNFQIAINLKRDYANAYYNLGHALESKGDLQNALLVYQTVQSLVGTDKTSSDKIKTEIAALQQKIGQQKTQTNNTPPANSETEQPPLSVNEPTQQLPGRNPKVNIPGVTTTPIPTEKPKGTPTPTGKAGASDTTPTPEK